MQEFNWSREMVMYYYCMIISAVAPGIGQLIPVQWSSCLEILISFPYVLFVGMGNRAADEAEAKNRQQRRRLFFNRGYPDLGSSDIVLSKCRPLVDGCWERVLPGLTEWWIDEYAFKIIKFLVFAAPAMWLDLVPRICGSHGRERFAA